MSEIKINVNTILVKDVTTGEEKTVKTVRTVSEIVSYIDETETDELVEIAVELRTKY